MGDCQNYGPFLGPYYNTGPNTGPNLGDPKRDHNVHNPPMCIRQAPLAVLVYHSSMVRSLLFVSSISAGVALTLPGPAVN